MTPSPQSVTLTTAVLILLLLVTIIRCQESDIQPRAEGGNAHHLQQGDKREWPGQHTSAVFPDDSNIAALALPGSQPIRSQNTYRRRRKRPRPEPPEDKIQSPSPAHVEGLETVVLPYKEQSSYYQDQDGANQGYQVYETSVSSVQGITDPKTLPSYSQQHHLRAQRRRPNSSQPHKLQPQELPHRPVEVSSPNIQVDTEEDVYHNENARLEEQSIDTSQNEHYTDGNDSRYSDSQSPVEENNYTYLRNRDDQHKQTRNSVNVSEVTELQQDSYREPYPAQSQGNNNDALVSPQHIKALLKQQSGSVSLSELLQQKNLSLVDLLKGNHNALSALTGVQNLAPESKTPDTNQESVPPEQLPPQTHSRHKNQRTRHQKPLQYSANQEHISEDHRLESTTHRRLPPVNTPSRRKRPLADTEKPIRYQVQKMGQTELHIRENTNKFIPSSPRRLPPTEKTPATDITVTSSTGSDEGTKLIIPEKHNTFPDYVFNAQKEKHGEIQAEGEGKDNVDSITSTTEQYVITNPPVLESSHRNSQEVGTKPKHPTTDYKPLPIPLNVQETHEIDPLQNSPEADTMDKKVTDHTRLHGKYIPRHRISVAQKNSNSKENTVKEGRVRLPPANLFLSPLRPRVINRTTSTKEPHDGTTMEPVQFISTVPQTQGTHRTVASTARTVEMAIKQLNSMPQIQDSGPLPSGQIINLTTEITSTTATEEADEPLHNIISFHHEPTNSQSQRRDEHSEAKITSARDEILEFLKTDMGSVHLARILASRNMTLAELIQHRERGSSQLHLADIFRESEQPITQPTEASIPAADDTESKHEIINNEVKNNIRIFQQKTDIIGTKNTNNIPTIQEMFSFLQDSHSKPLDHEINQQAVSASTQEQENSENHSTEESEDPEGYAEKISPDESQIPNTLSTFPPNPLYFPHMPTLRPSNPSMHSIPSWKISYQHPDTIYSLDPTNPYFNPGHRPIITSRLTTPAPLTSNGISHSIVLLENAGQVRQLASNGVKGIKGPMQVNRDEDKRYEVLYKEDLEDDHESDSGLPTDIKSTITVSCAILGLAILGFLAIFVVCRWKQKQARRRFADDIVSARAHSPILMQPEEKNIQQGLSPVMVNTQDVYKSDISLDGEDNNQNPGARRYYLWRTLRKTLRYK